MSIRIVVAVIATISAMSPFSALECQQISPDHEFQRTEINGVVTATNRGGPKYQGEIFRYDRIGQLTLPTQEGQTLDNVTHCAISEMGNVYISDLRNRRISIFDSSGNFIRIMGGPGSGPGEFQQITGMALVGDMVIVADRALLRLSLFNLDGSY